jgi:carbon storage regulator
VLVLSRKLGESLVVGNNIRVVVVEINGGVVRLGIEAPREVSILRAEIHGEIEDQNLRASTTNGPSGELLRRFLRPDRGPASGG